MVKKFISKTQPNSNEWLWPVVAKSESEKEKFLAGLLSYLIMLILLPRLNIVFLFFLWFIYQFKYISLKTLTYLALFSGALWCALGLIIGFDYLGREMIQSLLWKSSESEWVIYLSIWFLRSVFFASGFAIFCIYYNRRRVNPEKVHIKVVMRQRHERIRHMRKWAKTIDLKEVL